MVAHVAQHSTTTSPKKNSTVKLKKHTKNSGLYSTVPIKTPYKTDFDMTIIL